jgi:hypothetical protein
MGIVSDSSLALIHSGLLLPFPETVERMDAELAGYGFTNTSANSSWKAREIRRFRGAANPDSI